MQVPKDSKVVVYVPKGAGLNIENKSQDPPKTKYNDRQKTFYIDTIKKFIGGLYGRKE